MSAPGGASPYRRLGAVHTKSDGILTRKLRLDSPERPLPEDYEKQHDTPLTDFGCTAGCTCREEDTKGELPDRLARVVEAWPTLPEPLRRAVLAMIDAAG